jgi:hypothetical protein
VAAEAAIGGVAVEADAGRAVATKPLRQIQAASAPLGPANFARAFRWSSHYIREADAEFKERRVLFRPVESRRNAGLRKQRPEGVARTGTLSTSKPYAVSRQGSKRHQRDKRDGEQDDGDTEGRVEV